MKDKKNILYVDDEEINLRNFKAAFRRDFNIIIATSAKEGLKILEDNKIDVVLTDQRMPNMTGVQFLEKINALYPTIPPKRLIVSGYASDEQIEKAFNEYNLFQFINKPWKTDELKKVIIEALES